MRLLALLVVLLAFPAAALADPSPLPGTPLGGTDVADATGAVAPTAAGGNVVFSRLVPATGRFELVAWAAGTGLRVLPVGTRAVPFDADVGFGADGAPVVAFSRCATDAAVDGIFPALLFSRAGGCRLYVLSLSRAGATPRRLRLAGSTGLSLTTPSIHRRMVAAVAAPAAGSTNARILLWKRTGSTPVRLRGGSDVCPYDPKCKAKPATSVAALDLGPRSVAFLWRTDLGLGVGDNTQLRSSTFTGTGRALETGYVSGACGFRQPLSPTATQYGGVAFLLAQSPCDADQDETTLATTNDPRTGVVGVRTAGALAYGAAWNGADVFWLKGPAPTADSGPRIPCSAGCRLIDSDSPDLAAL